VTQVDRYADRCGHGTHMAYECQFRVAALPPPPADHDAPGALVDPRGQPYANGTRPPPTTASLAPSVTLFTIDELAGLKPPAWQIDGVLPDRCLSVIFGRQSTYKSFVALDWCLSIAAGVAWHGRAARPGTVVYIAAEGGPGLLRRIRAWQAVHPDADPAPRFRAIPHAVDLRSAGSVNALRDALRQQLTDPPALIVIDTWSRNTPGANENSAEDTSAAVGKLDEIRADHGAGVLVVHHSGLETGRERGSTALAGAVDCRWETDGRPNALTVVLRCHKQKDWSVSEPIPLRRHVVGDGPHASLILRLDEIDPCAEHKRVVGALDQAGAISQTQLETLVAGKAAAVRALAKATAECSHCPVESWPGARGATIYSRSDQQEAPL